MKSLNGVFVPADDETLQKIWNCCALHGFPLDSDGILQLLMLVVLPEDEETEIEKIKGPDPVKAIFDHIAANPKQAEILKDAGAKLFSSFMSKIKKGNQ